MNYRFLKNNEIINIELADKITKGPAGSANALKSKMPKTQEIAPIIKDPKEYWNKLEAIFRAAAAGVITKAPIKREPVTFMPKATIMAIQTK